MLKQLSSAFLFINDGADDPVVRMVEVEYTKEFRHLQRSLGRRPTRKEVNHIITG